MAAMIPSVDGVTFAVRELVASQREAARVEERERIVEYLRKRAEEYSGNLRGALLNAAYNIERGV